MPEVKKYSVWIEGYAATLQHVQAEFLGDHEAESFQNACIKAMAKLGYEFESYDPDRNTYWGCKFFDNEIDARKNFG